MSEKTKIRKTPKVFISYCWSLEANREWVLKFAERLTADGAGVEVVIDVWHLAHGHDKNSFMERSVTDSTIDKVLIVSDAAYARKADAREGGVVQSQRLSRKRCTRAPRKRNFLQFFAITPRMGSRHCLHIWDHGSTLILPTRIGMRRRSKSSLGTCGMRLKSQSLRLASRLILLTSHRESPHLPTGC